jgi:3-oxoacyl-[acyl-carrier protein] reductase
MVYRRRTSVTKRLEGQAAFVTGAGQGIGEAIAAALAVDGAAVAIADVNGGRAIEVTNALQEKGLKAIAVTCDVSDPAQVSAGIQTTAERFGGLQILVNSAGGMLGAKRKPVENVLDEDWDRLISVNLSGCFYTARAAVPYMKQKGYGRIINISSGAGRSHSRTGLYGYTSAKAGVHGLTRQLAVDLGAFGITCNAVAPGLISSPLGMSTWVERTEQQRQEVLKSIAVGRLGEPAEIADVVVFLASAGGGYITGQTIGVDGGHWMF